MAEDLACIQLTGRLGNDPELKYTANSTPVMRLSLAVNTGWGDRKKTSWYRCSFFGPRAEKLMQYLNKGNAVAISGMPEINEFTRDDGTRSKSIEVKIYQLSFQQGGQRQEHHSEPSEETEPTQGNLDESGDSVMPF